ncbi:y4mF family transcriptional regulator [Rhodoglobus vestalii]|uniref:Y4mF family transcriptional regulator n=1 Tax=Rhodoglobus vestalii TaxID=193384 RepID=A0A8H2PXG4_9MICO|nr:helix-turn-helix domain-containing protein [Rhodoglobus vestalii]TQO20230.1 y4mF family transcriptional regulator [Rhodoglobus vestalii]
MVFLATPADLGRAIRDKRLKLGLTQQELAERVGVARQWIIKVEKGKTRLELEPLLQTLFQLGLELRLDDAAPADDLDEYVQSFAGDHGASSGAKAVE